MANISRNWAGRIFGTNVGNVGATFENVDGTVVGIVRFNDELLGPVVYDVKGVFDGTKIEFEGIPKNVQGGQVAGEIKADGELGADGVIRGEWASSVGTGGNFVLHPHSDGRAGAGFSGPEQIYTANKQIGAVRLYSDELAVLVRNLERDMVGARTVVTYRKGGDEVSCYWDDFSANAKQIGPLKFVKLTIQAPDQNNTNRIAVVELVADGQNSIRTQGPQESWVIGKSESLYRAMSKHQGWILTNYRRYGNVVNNVIVISFVVLMPDMDVLTRFIFAGFTIILLFVFNFAHTRIIPNAHISFEDKKPSALFRAAPRVWSWLAGIGTAGIATVAVPILAQQTQTILKMLARVLADILGQ